MPRPPLPAELEAFLARPNPAVIATVRGSGSPHTAATWYLWHEGRLLVNLDEDRTRLKHLRGDPRVSLTVLDADGWHRHVTIEGRAISISPDVAFEGIDRLARHYTGAAFQLRTRGRVDVWIEVKSWHAWDGGGPWTPRLDSHA
jgi:PPOX class probable F420-dependent enzyme